MKSNRVQTSVKNVRISRFKSPVAGFRVRELWRFAYKSTGLTNGVHTPRVLGSNFPKS